MKRIYIPFNMIVDTDFGIIRLIEKVQNIEEYPKNKLKEFLLTRRNENPIPEYCKKRGVDVLESSYEMILEKYYNSILPLSELTDLLAFVINTYKLGVSNEMKIVIGCNYDSEIRYIQTLTSQIEYTFETALNEHIKLSEFDYIFFKYFDYHYIEYLIDNLKLEAKRLYVADYCFNKIYDREIEPEGFLDPELVVQIASKGNILSTVTLYNKKR